MCSSPRSDAHGERMVRAPPLRPTPERTEQGRWSFATDSAAHLGRKAAKDQTSGREAAA